MNDPMYGIIRITSHDPQDETAYIIRFDEGVRPTEAIEAALDEIMGDVAFIDQIESEFGYPSVRNAFCDLPQEPFNRRGIEFVSVYEEFVVDGDVSLGYWRDE